MVEHDPLESQGPSWELVQVFPFKRESPAGCGEMMVSWLHLPSGSWKLLVSPGQSAEPQPIIEQVKAVLILSEVQG